MSFDKLLTLALVAVLVIGPTKLPFYAAKLARFARAIRAFADNTQQRLQEEAGLVDLDWRKFDPRQYDPRRIIQDALIPRTELPPSIERDTTGPVLTSSEIAATENRDERNNGD